MAPRNPLDAELIVSYLTLRKAVGYIGLFCYRGPYTQDNLLTNIAGACAVAIGLLPTEPEYHPLIAAKFPNILSDECYRNHGPLGLTCCRLRGVSQNLLRSPKFTYDACHLNSLGAKK